MVKHLSNVKTVELHDNVWTGHHLFSYNVLSDVLLHLHKLNLELFSFIFKNRRTS